jgi:hypothetical protein
MRTETRSVEFVPPSHGLRGYTIVRNDRNPSDMRYEVVCQTGRRDNPVSWQFFSSRRAALSFAQEVR